MPKSRRRWAPPPASWTSRCIPDFKTNGLIYLSYHKPRGDLGSNAIFRGRWNGQEIVDGKDIFLSDDVDALYSALAFGPDGKLYATIGCPGVGTDDSIGRAQHPGDFAGKTLRLNDDGTVPKDNPFVGKKGYNPEIFTLGHRVNLGLTLNPWTKEFWVSEHGPNGGDEVNILKAGAELWLADPQRRPLLRRPQGLPNARSRTA